MDRDSASGRSDLARRTTRDGRGGDALGASGEEQEEEEEWDLWGGEGAVRAGSCLVAMVDVGSAIWWQAEKLWRQKHPRA